MVHWNDWQLCLVYFQILAIQDANVANFCNTRKLNFITWFLTNLIKLTNKSEILHAFNFFADRCIYLYVVVLLSCKWKIKAFLSDIIVTSIDFFKKKLADIGPLCGDTDTPVLDFWWRLHWVSKPGWIPSLEWFTRK